MISCLLFISFVYHIIIFFKIFYIITSYSILFLLPALSRNHMHTHIGLQFLILMWLNLLEQFFVEQTHYIGNCMVLQYRLSVPHCILLKELFHCEWNLRDSFVYLSFTFYIYSLFSSEIFLFCNIKIYCFTSPFCFPTSNLFHGLLTVSQNHGLYFFKFLLYILVLLFHWWRICILKL